MYILVNKDIKISSGKLAGQVGHAVDVWLWNNFKNESMLDLIEEYHQGEIKKIILSASHEQLIDLESNGFIAIRDKGYTELEENTLTCINVGIYESGKLPEELKFVSKLKLYK